MKQRSAKIANRAPAPRLKALVAAVRFHPEQIANQKRTCVLTGCPSDNCPDY
jgi:hypothetical protein